MNALEPRIVPTSGGWSLSLGAFAIAITKRRSVAQLLWLFLRDRCEALNISSLSASMIAEMAALPRSVVTGPNRFRQLGSLWGRAKVELWERIVRALDDQPTDVAYDFGTASGGEVVATLSAGFVLSGDASIGIQSIDEN